LIDLSWVLILKKKRFESIDLPGFANHRFALIHGDYNRTSAESNAHSQPILLQRGPRGAMNSLKFSSTTSFLTRLMDAALRFFLFCHFKGDILKK
jgi:hypothetical protein